ncbi:MAG: TolB family protein [Halanaerobiaceae bacterium]
MKFKNYFLVLFLLSLILFICPVQADAGFLDWEALETDNFTIFYPPEREWQARKIIINLENNRQFVTKTTGNQDDFKTVVVVEDPGLYSNGYANVLQTKISIFTNNPGTYSVLSTYNDWLRLVSVHEMTHIYQMSNTSGTAEGISTILGNLFSPNTHSPIWIIEGITVYNESQISPYEGRLNDGYYDALLAGKITENEFPTIMESTYDHDYFPPDKGYVYGGLFFQYLAGEYGEDKLAEYFTTYGGYCWAPFLADMVPAIGIDKAARKTFGKSYPELFQDWKSYEEERFKDWKIDGEKIVQTRSGEIKNIVSGNDKLYYFKQNRYAPTAFNYYNQSALVEYDIDTGTEKILESFTAPAGQLKIYGDKIYYSLKELSSGYRNIDMNGYGMTSILYTYDLKNGSKNKIFTDTFRDFALIDDNIYYVKDLNSKYGSELWQYKNGKQKLGETSQLISELHSQEDNLYTVSKKETGSWDINKLIIKKYMNKILLEDIVSTKYMESNIYLDGNYLYYTSNYSGNQAIYKVNLQNKKVSRLTTGGYSTNGVPVGNKIYFRSIDSAGEALYTKLNEGISVELPSENIDTAEERNPEETEQNNIEIREINNVEAFARQLSYLLKPHTRLFPELLAGSDALGINSYSLNYDYGEKVFDFNFTSSIFQPLVINYSNLPGINDRRNILGLHYPLTKSLRKGYPNINLNYTTDFDYSHIQVNANLNYPSQNVGINISKYLDYGIMGSLDYNYNLPSGNIKLSYLRTEDYPILEKVRGYSGGRITPDDGYYLSGELTNRLAKIRKGIWNPNVFIGDLYGTVYYDHYNFQEETDVYGFEFVLENQSAIYLRSVTHMGIAYDYQAEEVKPYISLNTSF